MAIIKKVKLNLIERNLENIVLLCSKIKAWQEELKCLEERMAYNQNEFLSGNLSESIFDINKRGSEKEKRKLTGKIEMNINKSVKKLENIEKSLKEVNI
jgi:hypothetical protein